MKKFFSVIGSMLFALTIMFTMASPADAGGPVQKVQKRSGANIDLYLRDMVSNEIVFKCGTIYRHRQIGVLQPGTVLMNRDMATSPTGDLKDLHPKIQGYIKACNQSHQTIYAGHSQPIFSIGIGVTRIQGGGNTNVYGSQAISGSNSGANAGANAASSIAGR
jgi:hypothetical protein